MSEPAPFGATPPLTVNQPVEVLGAVTLFEDTPQLTVRRGADITVFARLDGRTAFCCGSSLRNGARKPESTWLSPVGWKVVVSEKFWTALPADLRKIAEESLREASNFQLDMVANLDTKLLEDMKGKGVQVTLPDRGAFRAATAPAYDVFYAKFGDRGRKIIETIRAM